MNGSEALGPPLDRIERLALWIGAIALVVCLAGAWMDRAQFFHSYLMAYLFWIGITLGCFAIVMLHHLVGGGWGFLVRRFLESGAGTLPLMAVLMLPILFGLPDLYPWARAEATRDELLRHKSIYLNIPFFLARMALYFAAWLVIRHFLNKWSLEQDRSADPAVLRRLQLLSGPGLLVYGLTVTFASVDWVMSLEPRWFSTIYGAIFMVGQALSSLAFAIAVLAVLAHRRPIADLVSPEYFRDLGNLMLAFVMLWAYVQFSQFLIIWSGNVVEEIPWYLSRTKGGWGWIAAALILFHFFVPFFLLLSRDIKQRARVLAGLAVTMLFARLVDHFWMVEPALHPGALSVHLLDVAAPIAIGGLWMAFFIRQLKRKALVPLHDPRLERLELKHA